MSVLKKINPLYLLFFPFVTALFFLIYSYFWIDHGLVTFISVNRPLLSNLFQLIEYTSNNKITMAQWYLVLITLMFIWQFIFFIPKVYKSFDSKSVFFFLGIITVIYSLAYPFLSKDIFNNYISGKMAYFYHLNPYVTAPIEIADKDFFVLIAHNITATYVYGPVFLLYSILPMMIFGTQKIILYFITIKLMGGILFFISGLILYKLTNYDKRLFAIWFLNPFLLIESLSNAHNDGVMVSFFIIGFYYITKRKYIQSLFFIISSILIKFVSIITLPIFSLNDNWRNHYFKILGVALPILIYFVRTNIQPWYLTWSYMFLPLTNLKGGSWIIFSSFGFISLANYYRFLESGGWGAGLIFPNPILTTSVLIILIFIIEYFNKLKKIKL